MVYQSKYNDKISILIKKLMNLTKENKIQWRSIDKTDSTNTILHEYIKSFKKPFLIEKSYYTFINNGFIYIFSHLSKNKELDYYSITTQTKINSNIIELNKNDSINRKHQELIETLINIIDDNDVDDFINSILVMN